MSDKLDEQPLVDLLGKIQTIIIDDNKGDFSVDSQNINTDSIKSILDESFKAIFPISDAKMAFLRDGIYNNLHGIDISTCDNEYLIFPLERFCAGLELIIAAARGKLDEVCKIIE